MARKILQLNPLNHEEKHYHFLTDPKQSRVDE